jgi:hypothetical protein
VLKNTIDQARRGTFVNRDAIDRLVDAVVIDDFLFGPGFSGERALRFLDPIHDLRLAHSTSDSLARNFL